MLNRTIQKKILCLWFKEEPKTITEQKQQRHVLLHWAYKLSPLIAFDTPPAWAEKDEALRSLYVGLHIDLSGCEKLHGDDVQLLKRLNEEMLELGFSPRMALAPTLGAAWGFSRFSKNRLSVNTPQGFKQTFQNLPLAALRLEPKLLESLQEMSMTRVKQLVTLPRASLLSRFGPLVLKRLDQAFGSEQEPLHSTSLAGVLRSERIFSGPLQNQEIVTYTAEHLLALLLKRLQEENQKAAHLILEIKKVGCELQTKELTFRVPSAEYDHIWSLLSLQLEKLDLGHGVESLALSVKRKERTRVQATSHLPESGTPFSTKRQLGKLLDILGEHLGPEEVKHLEIFESYFPERAFSYRPLSKEELAEKRTVNAPALQPNLMTERPSILFHFPSPIQVIALLPDNPPSWLKWREKPYRIRCGIGPERIAPEWWGEDPALLKTRDYFKVQMFSGSWLWIFRELESNKWFIHGVWC